MKIVVYAICKNEAQFVSRWIKSMSEADQIVVLDTGSTDDTVERLRTLGAQVTVETICPWRFDVARNRSLELVDPDADICVCTDLDEVFHPGWRKALESAWIPGTTQATYRYTWSFRPDGGEGVVFWYEKIHARHGYRWVHPVHEVLEWMGPGQPGLKVSAEGVQLDHHPDPKKSRAQYLPLLELEVAEAPQDDRSVHYLGREYLFHSRWDDCIRILTQHLTMPSATWADERAALLPSPMSTRDSPRRRFAGTCGQRRKLPICGNPWWSWPCCSTPRRSGMGYSTLPKKRWPLWNVPAPTSAKLGPGELCPTTCAARPITTQADLSWPWRLPGRLSLWSPRTSGSRAT